MVQSVLGSVQVNLVPLLHVRRDTEVMVVVCRVLSDTLANDAHHGLRRVLNTSKERVGHVASLSTKATHLVPVLLLSSGAHGVVSVNDFLWYASRSLSCLCQLSLDEAAYCVGVRGQHVPHVLLEQVGTQ